MMRSILVGILVLMAAGIGWLTFDWYRARTSGEPYGGAFTAVDYNNKPITEAAFRGHPTALFFGFTHCPEVCPTTLAMLSGVRKALDAVVPAGDLPGIALFSVDPERDTPAVLDAYLASFGTGFRGYTGRPEAMRKFATALGVPYQRTPMMDGEYMVDHSTAILLINPQAEIAALFQAPQESAKLQADYLQVVSAAR